jgi:translation initiation factor IF-1
LRPSLDYAEGAILRRRRAIDAQLTLVRALQNKGKGGKNRRRGKNENDDDKRELVFREDGQEYAQVTKMLGNGRLEAQCFDGEKRLAHIRGKMRKKVRLGGTCVFVGLF